uniref:Tigger transposable element-derived protein 4 n=1 Tax=Phallusia mammillata TaxID=59560 RepID=A0A6F9DU28_9ASCI|nr:tigger transposable element-derived protein 4 [Phallusia mammillata]
MPRKRHELSLNEKIQVIEATNEGATQRAVAQKFEVFQTQVSRIVHSKDKLLTEFQSRVKLCRKRARRQTHEDIGDALLEWFSLAKSKGLVVNGTMLRQKAKDLAILILGVDFVPSLSWVVRWRERHAIKLLGHCESQSYCDFKTAQDWKTSIWANIKTRYSASDIYSCDETGPYFRKLPEKETLVVDQKFTEHLNILIATNMDGSDKLKLLVIGKHKETHRITGIKKLSSNSNAWVNSVLFQDWFKGIDDRLQKQNKKICFLLDNFLAYKIDDKEFKCIEFVFFPSNISPFVHPLHQGIIQKLKHRYRGRMLQKVSTLIEANERATAAEVVRSVSIADAVNFISASWNDVSVETIQSCFFRALSSTVCDQPFVVFLPEEIPHGFTEKTYEEYIKVDEMLVIGGIPIDTDISKIVKSSDDEENV